MDRWMVPSSPGETAVAHAELEVAVVATRCLAGDCSILEPPSSRLLILILLLLLLLLLLHRIIDVADAIVVTARRRAALSWCRHAKRLVAGKALPIGPTLVFREGEKNNSKTSISMSYRHVVRVQYQRPYQS